VTADLGLERLDAGYECLKLPNCGRIVCLDAVFDIHNASFGLSVAACVQALLCGLMWAIHAL